MMAQESPRRPTSASSGRLRPPSGSSRKQRTTARKSMLPWREVKGLVEDLSDEWFECRRGRITASKRMEITLHGTKRAKNAMLDELEAELQDGWVRVPTSSRYMEWGRNHEAEAIRNVSFM